MHRIKLFGYILLFISSSIFGQSTINTLDSDLLLYYPMGKDYVNGSQIADVSGNENHGTIDGCIYDTNVYNQDSTCYYFDGTNDDIQFSAVTFVDDVPWSVSFWVNLDCNWVDSPVIIAGADAADGGIDIRTNEQDDDIRWFSIIIGTIPEWIVTIPNGTWNHFVVICNGNNSNNFRLYHNNTLIPLWIGSASDTSIEFEQLGDIPIAVDRLKGSLDELRIYSRELTRTEVSQLYSK